MLKKYSAGLIIGKAEVSGLPDWFRMAVKMADKLWDGL
jgi:hypothetical protein